MHSDAKNDYCCHMHCDISSHSLLVFFLLLTVFSACGGIRTGNKLPLFNSLLSRAGVGHLGNGWIVRGTTTRRLPYWPLTGSSTQPGTVGSELQLIGKSGRLPDTDLTILFPMALLFCQVLFGIHPAFTSAKEEPCADGVVVIAISLYPDIPRSIPKRDKKRRFL